MPDCHEKKLWKIKCGFFLFLFHILLVFILPAGIYAAPKVEVTYTGNEGFLIEAEGKKILIDAFHRLGDVKNQELLQKVRQSPPPQLVKGFVPIHVSEVGQLQAWL